MRFPARSRAGSTLVTVTLALAASTIFAHEAAEPRPAESRTAILVSKLIEENHISHVRINDEVSAKLFKRYIELLDPRKLYFTQTDVDELGQDKTKLGELMKHGNVDFAYNTFDLFLKRVNERKALADTLVDGKHDFTVQEGMVIDAEKLPWAKNEDEIRERWRKQIKYDLLQLKLEDTADAEARTRVKKRYHLNLENWTQMDDGEKLELYLSALTHCLDPHSSYMSPQTRDEFRISMELRLEGIGAALGQEDGYTVVKRVVPGGAAEKDGRLKVGDKIIGVDSKGDGDIVPVVEMKLNKVVRMIRGPRGTKVRLQVKTAEHIDLKNPAKNRKSQVAIYAFTRRTVELTSQEVKGQILQAADRVKGSQARVGILNIPSFYRDFNGASSGEDDFKSTARDVQKVLENFKRQGGIDLLVIDLRGNGGGALSEAIEVSGLFIESGPIVQVKTPGGEKDIHPDTNPSVAYSGPLVVLTNRLSASASEIFAGVIKDYRRGIIVGDNSTHGKGTVQNVMPVGQSGLAGLFNPEDRGALKLTISQFYRVNGDSTQNLGVPSDVVLPSLLDHMDLGESSLENALKFDRVEPADYQPWNRVNPELVSMLQRRSQARVATEAEFQKLNKDIATFDERKSRKQISLNLEARKKERIQDKLEEKKADEITAEDPADGPIFAAGYYNNEVLRIGVDYLQLVHSMATAGK
ncbi:MAG TPA: carboxy terminal-processing peptidase [Planctomycetaceae bacterium]|jgi:carboxyl-terminal processing protease|nr:carboxy terminal-processing peptidase [Planctomycetaceae bacterium]